MEVITITNSVHKFSFLNVYPFFAFYIHYWSLRLWQYLLFFFCQNKHDFSEKRKTKKKTLLSNI